jgi:tyrosine-protein phosphatase YwqE
MHKLQSLSKVIIHLGVHNHLGADGKCKESLEETKRLIAEEDICMLDVKMFVISMTINKTLVRHLLNDCNYGIVEFFKGEQLEHIHDKFYELNFPNFRNLIAFFKHCPSGGYIDNIFELKSKS